MPYRDPEKRREAARESMRKRRQGLTMEEPLTPVPVNPQDAAWQKVREFILKPSNSRMSNLEKLQAIAESLGKYADDVLFGVGGLTMGDIGRVLCS